VRAAGPRDAAGRPRPPIRSVVLLVTVATGIVSLVFPLYARSIGASYGDLGLLGGVYAAANGLSILPAGRLGDRRGHTVNVIAGGLALAAATAIYALAPGIPWLVVGKAVEGIGMATLWPSLEAVAATVALARPEEGYLGSVFGVFAVANALGGMGGGWLTAAIGARRTLAVALAIFVAGVVTLGARTGTLPRKSLSGHVSPSKARPLWAVYASGYVQVIAVATLLIFFPVFAHGTILSVTAVGMVWGLYWGTRALGALWAPRSLGRLGMARYLCLAFGCTSLGLFVLATGAAWALAGGIVLAGIGVSAVNPAGLAAISAWVQPSRRGFAVSAFELSSMLGFLTASGAGWAVGSFDRRAPFLLAAALTAGWTLVLLAWAQRARMDVPAARGHPVSL
jgi:MFS family permease